MHSPETKLVFLFWALLTATLSSAQPGVQRSDGSDGAATPSQAERASGTGDYYRYLVPHMRSASFSSGIGGRVTTVITATNGGMTACDVTIDYYFAYNADSVPECSLTLPLAPLWAIGADTANACSRSITGDRWTFCTATCNPQLGFVQGKALIRVPANCAGAVSLDARLYHNDTAEDIRAINSLRVFPLNIKEDFFKDGFEEAVTLRIR